MPIKKHCYFCSVQVYNGVKEKVRNKEGKLQYICDTCLHAYGCFCNENDLCIDLCRECEEHCSAVCNCASRNAKAHNKDGVPYHWTRWLYSIYFTPYYARCCRYREMKKIVDSIKSGALKPEDAKFQTGSSSGPDGDFEYFIDYVAGKEIKVKVLPTINHPPEDTPCPQIAHESGDSVH